MSYYFPFLYFIAKENKTKSSRSRSRSLAELSPTDPSKESNTLKKKASYETKNGFPACHKTEKWFMSVQRIRNLFLVSYNTMKPLQRLNKYPGNVFQGVFVLYESKKGFRIRCKLINPSLVPWHARNPFLVSYNAFFSVYSTYKHNEKEKIEW
jgi:hypothetical protein